MTEILLHTTSTQPISISEVAEYTCPYCGATFSTQQELDAHIQQEHPEKVPWYDEKYYGLPMYIYIGASVGLALIIALARR